MKTPLKTVFRRESDFTEWLATPARMQAFGRAMGLDLRRPVGQFSVGGMRADIVATSFGAAVTSEQSLVVVEAQWGTSDHDHLGKVVTYASGAGATRLIWIAEQFRPEHLHALRWLSESTPILYEAVTVSVRRSRNPYGVIGLSSVPARDAPEFRVPQFGAFESGGKNDSRAYGNAERCRLSRRLYEAISRRSILVNVGTAEVPELAFYMSSGLRIVLDVDLWFGVVSLRVYSSEVSVALAVAPKLAAMRFEEEYGYPTWQVDFHGLKGPRRQFWVLDESQWGDVVEWVRDQAVRLVGVLAMP